MIRRGLLGAVAAVVVAAGGAVAPPAHSAPDGPRYAVDRMPWWRSAVVHHGRVVRLAVRTRASDRVLSVAHVRFTRHTVRIGLRKRRPRAVRRTANANLFCVQVRLREPVGGRVLVDGNSGRAPDRAPANSPLGRQRDDTLAVNLRGGACRRLKPIYR